MGSGADESSLSSTLSSPDTGSGIDASTSIAITVADTGVADAGSDDLASLGLSDTDFTNAVYIDVAPETDSSFTADDSSAPAVIDGDASASSELTLNFGITAAGAEEGLGTELLIWTIAPQVADGTSGNGGPGSHGEILAPGCRPYCPGA